MTQKPVTGGVLVPACSPCDAQDRFLETTFADMLELACANRWTGRISAAARETA